MGRTLTVFQSVRDGVEPRPLLVVLAAVFAGLATVLTIGAAVSGAWLALFAAVPLAVTALLMWYQGTGRLAGGLFRTPGGRRRPRHSHTTVGGASTQDRDGGDDDQWEDPFWEEAQRESRHRARRQARRRARGRSEDAGTGGDPNADWRHGRRADRLGGRTLAESYDVLGLDPGASEESVREAYREKAKTLHPDTEEGSAEAFQELNDAYERILDEE